MKTSLMSGILYIYCRLFIRAITISVCFIHSQSSRRTEYNLRNNKYYMLASEFKINNKHKHNLGKFNISKHFLINKVLHSADNIETHVIHKNKLTSKSLCIFN